MSLYIYMNTKDRIIEVAIKLFNKSGTKDVTTNHIADTAGISPGNLYYHFRNKEEIIRAIYSRIIVFMESESSYGSGFNVKPSIEHMEDIFRKIFTCQWEYRFFYRELNALLNRDRELKKIFRNKHQQWFHETNESIRAFIDAGIFRDSDEPTINFMKNTLWIIGTYWHSFMEAGGDRITKARAEEGINIMRQFLKPYLSEVTVGS